MSPRTIPRFEPEVIAAGAARRGDDEKVATTMLGSIDVHGVTVSSRYSKADEVEAMAAAITSLSAALRAPILTFFCDSRACEYEGAVAKLVGIAFGAISSVRRLSDHAARSMT